MSNHGKVQGYGRLCDKHGDHGILYPCPEYDKETLQEISLSSKKYINNLKSKSWCEKQQKETGCGELEIEIFRTMAGIDENDWTP